MHVSNRFFQNSGQLPAAAPPQPKEVDSDILVTLAALLCALICVLGLAFVARCAWLRRSAAGAPPTNKGMKKKAIRSLPRLSFRPGGTDGSLAECAICLSEFAEGDEIRVLPRCGHCFHVACVDVWLGSHSSCPSCRQVPVVGEAAAATARRQKCGASSGAAAAAAGVSSAPAEDSEGGADRYLP